LNGVAHSRPAWRNSIEFAVGCQRRIIGALELQRLRVHLDSGGRIRIFLADAVKQRRPERRVVLRKEPEDLEVLRLFLQKFLERLEPG
jgi:hypothetical protein